MSTSEAQRQGGASTAIAKIAAEPGGSSGELLPLHNGVMSPDKWTMFGRMAYAVADTDFVPKGLRKNPPAIMACLIYGDSLGLHPSVSLTDVYVADGKVGISGALMLSKIREAGHKVTFHWVLDANGERIGSRAVGQRIEYKIVNRKKVAEVVEEDEWTYTLDDAKLAGLYPNSSPRAAWMKSPMVMCRWRALAQLARFLFPDLFRGGSVYVPDEADEIAYSERLKLVNGAPAETRQDDGVGIEYGDDPLLAAWLIALFAAANEIEPGVWLPKKVKLTLKGQTQEGRELLAGELARWVEDRGGVVPERPTDEETVGEDEVSYEAVSTAEEGLESDDPGAHLNGDGDDPDGGDNAEIVTLD